MIVSHDGKRIWVTTETPQAVLELDSATGKILHVWNTTQERSHMIVAMPNETKFYVTNTVSGSVSVIDRSTGEVKVVSTGPGTEGIAISPDGKYLFSANGPSNDVSVVDLLTNKEIAKVKAGDSPWGITVAAAGT
jgi:YVTN family beta-propeller protein